jgi:hypothetical protein
VTAPASPAQAAPDLRLHVPDEPVEERARWLRDVLGTTPLSEVLTGDAGIARWLWERWQVLERSGMTRDAFVQVVLGYRREIWLWLVGERTWEQCCSELIGRATRRIAA